jgi:hypothetical protein
VGTLFADDGVTAAEVETLLDAFPAQPLDFFGALRNRLYDGAVRSWIGSVGGHTRMGDSLRDSMRGAVSSPVIHAPEHAVSLDTLLAAGASLAYEQQLVMDGNLSREYLHWQAEVRAHSLLVDVSQHWSLAALGRCSSVGFGYRTRTGMRPQMHQHQWASTRRFLLEALGTAGTQAALLGCRAQPGT